MTEIPFTKLHGAENDFLLTWAHEAPAEGHAEIARAICARTTGIGADGWMLVSSENERLRTRLFNSDGSKAEMSGNGTRCAGAFGLVHHAVTGPEISIETGAGLKTLRLLSRESTRFLFDMDMGLPRLEELHAGLKLTGVDFDATVLNVGNPQCAIFVEEFPANWLAAAHEAERHPRFPNRTNVSFVRVVDAHTIEARFFERGAGETRSSGTGSTGAALAAILRKVASSPVQIRTPAGTLNLRWDTSVYLTGPVQVIGHGRFTFEL
jgi:diaminopimelate epimerase